MKKRILATIIAAFVMISALPAVSFGASKTVSINDKAVVYTPYSDYKSGDCILTSSRNMIRRAAILRGSKAWSKVTNATLRKDATIFGLLWHNFSHSTDGLCYTIKMQKFTGKTEKERIKEFEKLIKDHPEGVVVWGKKSSIFGEHGILLTDVKNGVPYAADSAHNLGNRRKGIEKWSDTTMYSPLKCTRYWYIKQVSIAKGAKAPAKGKPLKPTSAGNVNMESTLRISDASKPVSIKQGNGYPVEGVIESNYRISKVAVSIIDKSGKSVISKSAAPSSWIYDIGNLDSAIKFGTLAAGSYKYRVTATDEKKTATLIDSAFTVTPAQAWITIRNAMAPESVQRGNGYPVRGVVSSGSNITFVNVSIINSSGKTVVTASAKPGRTSYNLKNLDSRVKFGGLSKGSYRYVIKATAGGTSKTLVNKTFSVYDKKTQSSNLMVKSYNVPSNLKKGKPFYIKGKLSSNKAIKKVTIQITDAKGKVRLSASANNNKKSFNLRVLDPKIKFGKLDKGTYTYKVIATDTVQTKTLVNKGFRVQ